VRALLLDVEGTTTPIAFVTRVLFPYAREHVRAFLEAHAHDAAVAADLRALAAERAAEEGPLAPPPWSSTIEAAVAYVHFLMDQDRKSTALKSLQGRMWAEGYAAGVLRGEVYPDVAPAFARWRAQGREIAIFSSGSVRAQKLIFRHLPGGDLTPFLRAYFDTTTGPKRDPRSYGAIAGALGMGAGAVLFLSDVGEELDAARAAGLRTALCVREGGGAAAPGAHPVIRGFDEVCP
jgi:enolase-phosphatase E1